MSGARIDRLVNVAGAPVERGARWAAAAGLGGAIVFALVILCFAPDESAIATTIAAATSPLIVWIVWRDVTAFTISDAAVFALAVLATAGRLGLGHLGNDPMSDTLFEIGAGAIVPGGSMLAFREFYYRWKGYDGLGLGDVKLAAAGGILIGPIGFSWALLGASLAGLCFVAFRALARRPVDRIAFGAVLGPAFWILWIAERMPLSRALGYW